MRNRVRTDRIVAIALLVLGLLVLVGEVGLGWLVPFLGVALLALGALILLGVLDGTTFRGVLLLVLGALLQAQLLAVPGIVVRLLNVIVGIVLVVAGIKRLLR